MDFAKIKVKAKNFLTKLQNLPEHQKKIILWTIVAVLGVAMGYFWLTSTINSLSKIGESVKSIKMPNLELSGTDLLSTTTPSNENLSAANQTADWKTYTNKEYGFEIKIPKDWFFGNINGKNDLVDFSPVDFSTVNKSGEKTVGKDFTDSSIGEYFNIYQNIIRLRVSESPADCKKDDSTLDAEKTIIAGINGCRVKISVGNWADDENIVPLADGKNSLFIEHVDSSDSQNIFNQIISTFKFTK